MSGSVPGQKCLRAKKIHRQFMLSNMHFVAKPYILVFCYVIAYQLLYNL